jgi:hypothetical protein
MNRTTILLAAALILAVVGAAAGVWRLDRQIAAIEVREADARSAFDQVRAGDAARITELTKRLAKAEKCIAELEDPRPKT